MNMEANVYMEIISRTKIVILRVTRDEKEKKIHWSFCFIVKYNWLHIYTWITWTKEVKSELTLRWENGGWENKDIFSLENCKNGERFWKR